jgi:hypothetical protein
MRKSDYKPWMVKYPLLFRPLVLVILIVAPVAIPILAILSVLPALIPEMVDAFKQLFQALRAGYPNDPE